MLKFQIFMLPVPVHDFVSQVNFCWNFDNRMGISGLLPFLKSATRPCKIKEFSGRHNIKYEMSYSVSYQFINDSSKILQE
jgi:hypothetical protein